MKPLLSLIGIWTFSSLASAANPVNVEDYLRLFHRDPVGVMNDRLPRWDENGLLIENRPLFTTNDFQRSQALEVRDELRADICRRAGADCEGGASMGIRPFAQFDKGDQVEQFLYQEEIVRNLKAMEDSGLTVAVLAESPWSDSFWPIQKGMIARRYADGGFPDSRDWSTNFGYFLSNPPWSRGSNVLSPAEKYDLLVGDSSWRLTQGSWRKGQRYIERTGKVPGWVGLCHGWAPASFMFPRPMNRVTARGVRGNKITFFPSDLKALSSLLWGQAPGELRFIGNRCKKNNPTTDRVGRVVDEKCFNTNPGTWHVAIVNQLGRAKRSFVFDATYDFEVWNYPLYAYQYSYFNPQTLAASKKLVGSVIPISRYAIDKFKKYRSPEAKYVVGVAMDVTYSIPSAPSSRAGSKPRHETVRYVYDLELDAGYQIIGGEWYSNFHPDFIWNPAPKARALSSGEIKYNTQSITWDGESEIPDELIKAARTSSGQLQPVGAIIEGLFNAAK